VPKPGVGGGDQGRCGPDRQYRAQPVASDASEVGSFASRKRPFGDHTAQLPQITHFAQTRRVVAIHLRGHEDSDSPEQDYTMAGFADESPGNADSLSCGSLW
jgi:hypothetical protein